MYYFRQYIKTINDFIYKSMLQWSREFKGQSPGDLENKKNGFAGRFLGYDSNIRSPNDKIPSTLPVILIVADSIISETCIV